jgi:hypothetical protein
MGIRPPLLVVLGILTLIVGVVAFRITRESGIRRVQGMAKEAQRLFAAFQRSGEKAPARDPAEIEERVREWVGAGVSLPKDESYFKYFGATKEKVGRQAAAIRLTFSGQRYLLMVVRPETLPVAGAAPALFSESSLLSWRREGMSFVFWERGGMMFLVVSAVDLTDTFDLVRRYFT